ncbi:MAG: lipopolysaccharide kinase InaA family protein [Rhodospirillales bacterium]
MFESIGPYEGLINARYDSINLRAQLASFQNWLASAQTHTLSTGHDFVLRCKLGEGEHDAPIVVKVFGRQIALKDWYDRKSNTKAARSYLNARFLADRNIGTAEPIAFLNRWKRSSLVESYYLSAFVPGISFKDALNEIYKKHKNNEDLMRLLEPVASAVKELHDAGYMHGDLGNQNILLQKSGDGGWLQPNFIDLNRSKRYQSPLTDRQKANDLARIALPGKYLQIFLAMYNQGYDLSHTLAAAVRRERQRFWAHRRRSRWRHPIRNFRYKKEHGAKTDYPPDRDLWLWDDKTSQPMVALSRAEKWHSRNLVDSLNAITTGLISGPKIFRAYRKQLDSTFSNPIQLKNKFGIALNASESHLAAERRLLSDLGDPPVLIRFYHHQTTDQWKLSLELVRQLHEQGVEVSIAILQDRDAILHPHSWESFLTSIVSEAGDKVKQIEVAHAINRTKWGVWSSSDLKTLFQPLRRLQKRFPQVRFMGPACIDFEYHAVVSALAELPKGLRFDSLSHHLYVDRRGAPEGKQGGFSTVEKSALLKAIAKSSEAAENKVVISEVNWPLKNRGIWSPVSCPYQTKDQPEHPAAQTEQDYADFMIRFLALTVCSGHVDQVFWWRLSAHGYGIVDDLNNFAPRPAFHALRFFLSLLGNATFIKRRATNQGTYLLEFSMDGKTVLMGWNVHGDTDLPHVGVIEKGWGISGEQIQSYTLTPSPSYYLLAG